MKPIDPRLLRYSRSSRGFILLTAALAVINALLTIFQAFLLSEAVVRVFQRHLTISLFSRIGLGLLSIFVIRAFINFFGDWISAIASTRIRNELREKLLESALHHGSQIANEGGSARLAILATKGINDLDGYFSKFLPQLLIAVTVPATVGLVIFFKDWRSGAISLFTVPLIPIFGIMIGRYTASATSKKLEALGVMGGYFLDLVTGLSTLKVFGRDHLQSKKVEEVGDRYRKETMKVLKISFISSLALELVATLSVALMAVSIGLRLVHGSVSLQTGLMVLILAPEVYWPIRQVASYFHAASDGIAVFEQLYALFERPAKSGNVAIQSLETISWSQLEVDYPGREKIFIPAGQISKGEIHAVVGVSGSGKSTLAKILLGFFEPSGGEVAISTESGTHEIRKIDSHSWHNLVSWMPQEPIFPVGTLREILKHSSPNAVDELLISTLVSAGLSISDLQHGLETRLGTSKAPLSIGQLRKIALARAVLKPAPLLILDEPSASVDDLSETQIEELIKAEALKGRLILLISHRKLESVLPSATTYVGDRL